MLQEYLNSKSISISWSDDILPSLKHVLYRFLTSSTAGDAFEINLSTSSSTIDLKSDSGNLIQKYRVMLLLTNANVKIVKFTKYQVVFNILLNHYFINTIIINIEKTTGYI